MAYLNANIIKKSQISTKNVIFLRPIFGVMRLKINT
jgi:hypothetical protein